MKEVLMVAIDGSSASVDAINYAVKLAKATGYKLELFHVQPKINTYYANKKVGKKQLLEYKKECALRILKSGRNQVDKDVDVSERWKLGIAAKEICKEAENIGAVGIVLGTKNMKTIKGRLLGSTSYSVIKYARCPVTVVS